MTSTPAPWLIVAPAVLLLALLAGAALLWRGLRGRTVDDHPLCRRCRFDLTGLPAGRANCPECGADLAAPQSKIVGHRERRRGPVALGLALLIPALLAGGGAAWWAGSDFDFTPHKPVWLLVRQADGPAAPGTDAAREELFRRLAAGELSGPQMAGLTGLAVRRVAAAPAAWPTRWGLAVLAGFQGGTLSAAQTDAVTDRALAIQSDPAIPWDFAWGDWVEQARAAGKASDARWRRYARQAVPPLTVRVRPRVAAGVEAFAGEVTLPGRRGANDSQVILLVVGERTRFDDAPWHLPLNYMTQNSSLGSPGSAGALAEPFIVNSPTPPSPLVAWLSPGRHRLAVRAKVIVQESYSRPPLVEWTEEPAADFTVLPLGESSTVPVKDPAAEPAVLAALRVRQLERDESDPAFVGFYLEPRKPPVGLSFDLFLRDAAGREWPMSGVTQKAGRSISTYVGGKAAGLAAGPVDVLLRPSRMRAEGSLDLTSYWGRPAILRGVKLRPPTTRPTSLPDPDPARAEAWAGDGR